jgi:hypothetical protein
MRTSDNVIAIGLIPMYKKMYWGQILNLRTSWRAKKIAVKSLLSIRGW